MSILVPFVIMIIGVALATFYVMRDTTKDMELGNEQYDAPITMYVGEEGAADVVISKTDKELSDYIKVEHGSEFIFVSRNIDTFYKHEKLNFLLVQKASRCLCVLFSEALADNNEIDRVNIHLETIRDVAIVSTARVADSVQYRFVYIVGDFELQHSIVTYKDGHAVLKHNPDPLFRPAHRVPVDDNPLMPAPTAPQQMQTPFEEDGKFGIKDDDMKIIYMRSKKSKQIPALITTFWNLFMN